MRSLALLVMGSLVVGAWLCPSQARATCSYECDLKMVNDDCSTPQQSDDDRYRWESIDEVRMLATCTMECCSPAGDGCSTDETNAPLHAFSLRDDSESPEYLDAEWTTEQACEGTVVVGSVELEAGRTYAVGVDSSPSLAFEVLEDAEGGASGCRIGGGPSLGFGALVLLGLVARQRSG